MAPVSPTLHFQGSVKARAGLFLPVSISCGMWDLLIRVTCSPTLAWALGNFFSLQSTLKLLQSAISELKVEQLGKTK